MAVWKIADKFSYFRSDEFRENLCWGFERFVLPCFMIPAAIICIPIMYIIFSPITVPMTLVWLYKRITKPRTALTIWFGQTINVSGPVDDMVGWCEKNLTPGNWHFAEYCGDSPGRMHRELTFRHEADRMAFKLVWDI